MHRTAQHLAYLPEADEPSPRYAPASHERGPRCRGLAVDRDGVALGPTAALVRRTPDGYRCTTAAEIARLMGAAGSDAPTQRVSLVLDGIAMALTAGDLVKAQLLGLEISIGELDDEQLAQLAACPDMMKGGFNADQPRDEGGRWTSAGDAGTKPARFAQNDSGTATDAGAGSGGAGAQPARSMSVSDDGLKFIAQKEGFKPNVYLDAADHPTIGYGHKLRPGESYPDGIAEPEARRLLDADVARAEAFVRRNVAVDLTQPQFDALISFTYNVGSDAFANSTLLRQVNAGNFNSAAAEFPRWNKVKKQGILISDTGLTNRRAAEQNLFLNGSYQ